MRELLKWMMKSAKYILWDKYDSDLPAGSVIGTSADGGGTATDAQKVRNGSDTGGKISINGGRLVSSGKTATNDPKVYYGTFTRIAGLTSKSIFRWIDRGGHGWAINTTPSGGRPTFGVTDFSGILTITPPFVSYSLFSTNIDYTFWMTLFSTGGAIWVQGGTYTNPTLLWVSDAVSGDVSFFPITNQGVAGQCDSSDVKILMSTFTTPQSIASVYITNPGNGVNYISNADGLHYLTLNLPVSPSAGDKVELRYRYQDASNYWTAYAIYNGGTSQWDFMLDVFVAGSATNKITVANIGSSVTDILVIASGNTHNCFYRIGAAWTKAGAQITDVTFATSTEVGPWYLVGSASLLKSFARTWNL